MLEDKGKEDNFMKFIKYFIIVSIYSLLGACSFDDGILEVEIGDYENQLEAWNSQNMLDYRLRVIYRPGGASPPKSATIDIKNGIPESSIPPSWIFSQSLKTVPDFFSRVKIMEQDLKKKYNNDNGKNSYSLRVYYDNYYHYPSGINETIKNRFGKETKKVWGILLMPLEEGELEIDIGDYENQLQAWNNQNMLDYQYVLINKWGDYFKGGYTITYPIRNVENGIPQWDNTATTIGTIPECYSFIKKEEERIRNEHNGLNRSYLIVQYNTEYHYPEQISSGIGYLFGSYDIWEITLTPLGEKEQIANSREQ